MQYSLIFVFFKIAVVTHGFYGKDFLLVVVANFIILYTATDTVYAAYFGVHTQT